MTVQEQGTAYVHKSGAANLRSISLDAVDNSATPGATTINGPAGQAAVANGASSCVVTNNFVSASSLVLCAIQDNTDALSIRSIVPGAGSFTLNLSGVTTGARKFGFVVIN